MSATAPCDFCEGEGTVDVSDRYAPRDVAPCPRCRAMDAVDWCLEDDTFAERLRCRIANALVIG